MTLWSKEPPSEPGWYWTIPAISEMQGRERYGKPLPVSFAGTYDGLPMLRSFVDGYLIPSPALAALWWGPRIEQPPWPEVKEASHE